MRRVTVSNTSMHWSGYFPTVVSPLSMMASACSKTAFATSVISARVGIGFVIMLSSRCVATITGRPISWHFLTMRRWMIGSSSYGHSMPRSPRATITPSEARAMASKWSTANWCSILAMSLGWCGEPATSARSCAMSSGSRTKLSAMRSTPTSSPSFTSALSLSVNAGSETRTPGRLMWRRLPICPSVSTSHTTRVADLERMRIRSSPLSTISVLPTSTSAANPS